MPHDDDDYMSLNEFPREGAQSSQYSKNARNQFDT